MFFWNMSKEKKSRFKKNKFIRYFDYSAIIFGVVALASNIALDCPTLNNVLCIIAAVLWVCYAGFGLWLLLARMPKFDWLLGNGHFLRKVIAFVLLCPFFIASIFVTKAYCDKDFNFSPKNLLYEKSLYTDGQELADSGIKEQKSPSIFATVFYHFIDPGNQHMTTSYKGRAIATGIGILGVFLLNGLLVSSLVGWIDSRKERWLKGEIRYRHFLGRKKHYVIIGGHDSVFGIVKQLLEKPQTEYILIQTSCDVEEFRRELFSDLTISQQQHIIIYYGNRTSERDIKRLRLEKAIEVYILGEEIRNDDIESFHDTRNMEALHLAYHYLNDDKGYVKRTDEANRLKTEIYEIEKKENITEEDKQKLENDKKEYEAQQAIIFRVMFEYQTSFSVFQFSEISTEIKKRIQFKPFNYYEMWAQKVLINKNLKLVHGSTADTDKISYLPLEGTDGIGPDSDKYVHLFIVGMSRMGVVLGIEAAHLAHYPNFATKLIRTKISFIDKNSADEKDFFMGRFKELFDLSHWRYGAVAQGDEKGVKAGELYWDPKDEHTPEGHNYLGGDFLDIEWEFINGGIENKSVKDYILKAVSKENCLATIAMCLPEPSRCLAAALYLGRDIYENKHVKQILVYNRYGDSLITEMTHHSKDQMNPYGDKLKAFGMAAECYDAKIISDAEEIATAVGKEYTILDEAYKAKHKDKNLDEGKGRGKSTVAKWWSNIYNANTLWTKLRCIQWNGKDALSNDATEILAATEHARWNMEQLLMGYRPLTETEQKEVIADLTQKNRLKGELAHLDICSYKKLEEIDKYALNFDYGLSKILPDVYHELQINNEAE